MGYLSPCPACARHVRLRSAECPFCQEKLELGAEPPTLTVPRLGRAAYFAFRTLVIGSAGAGVGCGASSGLEVPDASPGFVDTGVARGPADGGPVSLDASLDAGLDAGFVASLDAGLDDAGDVDVIDAGWDAGIAVGNLYGAAPGD